MASNKFSKNDNAKQYKFYNTTTGTLSTPPVSDLIDLSTKPSKTEINQVKANAIIKYAKSKILTLSDDFINKFENFATSHYFNTYGKDISFNALFIPESKSEHVNQFAKLIHNKYGLSATTEIHTIKKIAPTTLFKTLPPSLKYIAKLTRSLINKNKISGNIGDSLLILFLIIYRNINKSNNISEAIKTACQQIGVDNPKLNNAHKCILLASVIYEWFTASYKISSANNIRSRCNSFINESVVNPKTIEFINNFFSTELPLLSSPKNYVRDYLKEYFKPYNSPITPSTVEQLDAYMSHYYDNLPHISKSSAELNILCVDDNTNIGSTVFEITRKLKTEIKNYKKINVHWIVLFLPRNDIDIYGGENYVFDYTNRIYYSNKSEKREYEQQYNNQLEEYKQKTLDKKQYNE